MAKKETKVAKKDVAEEIKMYCVSCITTKKGRENMYIDDENLVTPRYYSTVAQLPQAVASMGQWQKNTSMYRDVRLHEISPGRKVIVKTTLEDAP